MLIGIPARLGPALRDASNYQIQAMTDGCGNSSGAVSTIFLTTTVSAFSHLNKNEKGKVHLKNR